MSLFDLENPKTRDRLKRLGERFNKYLAALAIEVLQVQLDKFRKQADESEDESEGMLVYVVLTSMLSFALIIIVLMFSLFNVVFVNHVTPWWLFAEIPMSVIAILILSNMFTIWRKGLNESEGFSKED